MKIGLLGGTFNPVHNAHLRIAAEALRACALERVLLIPAADPPHKPLAGEVPFAVRCRMVELAIREMPAFGLCTIEGERPGKSYSIETIAELRRRCPADELHFIIGGDSFLEIGLWYRYEDIFAACNLIVVQRPGSDAADPLAALPDAVRGRFTHDVDARRLRHSGGTTVQFVAGEPLDISSTEIRRRACLGQPIDDLVPPAVAAYITQQRIYSTCL